MAASRDRAISGMLMTDSRVTPAGYPKVWMRTSLKASSSGSHWRGQKCSGLFPLLQVLWEPPFRPWTKIRSATGAGCSRGGMDREVSPRGPLDSRSPPSPVALRFKLNEDRERKVLVDKAVLVRVIPLPPMGGSMGAILSAHRTATEAGSPSGGVVEEPAVGRSSREVAKSDRKTRAYPLTKMK